MSEGKKPRTLWRVVKAEVYGWAWIGTWFAAIWWEEYRVQLFWTGLFCAALGMLIVYAMEDE